MRMASMRMGVLRAVAPAGLAVAALLASPAVAEPGGWVRGVKELPAQGEPAGIAVPVTLPRPDAPKSPAPEGWAQQDFTQRMVYNVTAPTLLPMPSRLPADKDAPAVILVPGGGYLYLAMDNEGFDVAKRLDGLGVRVFVLKYRTLPIAGGYPGFIDVLTRAFIKGQTSAGMTDNRPYAVADTLSAIRVLRANAAKWHVDPAKVGILGFSAGAVTVLGAAQQGVSADARPDFVGMIYGPTQDSKVPEHAPPLFAAIAADDRFFKGQDLSLIHNWRLSGAPVEFHLYSAGGHGFASHPNGTTSDGWYDQFALWMRTMQIAPAR